MDAAKYIATYYPDFEARVQIEELDLSSKSLNGELDLVSLGFTSLISLKAANNHLTKVVLSNPAKTIYLDISNNKLTFLNTSEISDVLTYGEIKNNPSLPKNTRKDFLIKRWNYYKQVEMDYPDKLVPRIMELVDISDLDSYVTNYDFDREGEQGYHTLIGVAGYTYLDEYALEMLSQQVLARALIKQNELMKGKDEEYEKKINNLARQFQKAEEMAPQQSLSLIQQKVWMALNKDTDLAMVFQKQLRELATLLDQEIDPKKRRSRRSSLNVPNPDAIKVKIQELQNITTRQNAEITELRQSVQEKVNDINRLSLVHEKKMRETVDSYEDKLNRLSSQVSNYDQRLTVAISNEQVCRQKITELETQLQDRIDSIVEIKEKHNALIKERNKFIDKYQQMKKQLDQAKSDLQTKETMIKKLKGEDQINYWKWGLIGIIVLAVAGLIWWGYKKLRNWW